MTNAVAHTINNLTVEDVLQLSFMVPFSIIVGIGAGIIVLSMFGFTFGKED